MKPPHPHHNGPDQKGPFGRINGFKVSWVLPGACFAQFHMARAVRPGEK
jgi:hypothetical protein